MENQDFSSPRVNRKPSVKSTGNGPGYPGPSCPVWQAGQKWIGLGQGPLFCHKPSMTLKIRPHHLLCLLTYLGKGYTPAFVANYDRIVERLNAKDDVELIWAPDDICQPMLGETACHCHNESVLERDQAAAQEIGMLLGGAALSPGAIELSAADIARLRRAFSDGTIRTACTGCEWQDLCSSIARSGFQGCRLAAPS